MFFPVAVGANEIALIEFGFDRFKVSTACAGNAELFCLFVTVMELQSIGTTVVPASLALAALVGNALCFEGTSVAVIGFPID